MLLGPRASGPPALTAYVSFEAEAFLQLLFFVLEKSMKQGGL